MISNSIATRTIRNLEELETVRGYWEAWQTHPNSDFSHFQLVCRLRSEVLCPYVAVVERDGRPCALLAARLERTHFVPAIGYFKPIRIPATVLTVIHEGLLGQVDEKIGEELVRHVWSFLSSGAADAAVFHQLPEHSPLLGALLIHKPKFWCQRKPVWSKHWYIELPEEEGFILRNMKRENRKWLVRREKKLSSDFHGKVTWRWEKRFDDLPHLCARIEDVAARTYQRGLGAGFANDEEHRQRYALFAGRGQLRVQLLEVEEKVRAFRIGIIYHGVFHGSDTGYDPELKAYRPGTLAFVRNMDELVREGIRKFDFGQGDAHHKERFSDQSRLEATIRLFSPTVKGLAIRSSLGFSDMFDAAGRRLVQKLGVLDRLKTGWRRRLAPSRPDAEEK